MQLIKSVALLLAGLSAAEGYRDQSTKKSAQNSRRLPGANDGMTCTVDHDAAQTESEVQVHLGTFPGEGKGLFKITIKDAPFGSAAEPEVTFGWCIDYDRFIDKGYWSMDIFSAYDADLHFSAVDDRSMLLDGNLAFLINNVNVGDMWPAQGNCPGALINWKDLQGAIWKLIDDKDGTGTWYAQGRTECVAEQIAQYARDHGSGYELDCHDPFEEVPLILISDDNTEKVLNQVIVSETNIHSVAGLCSCEAVNEPAPEPRNGPSDDPKSVCKETISMDFETDGEGNPTSKGMRAKNLYEALGIEITTNYGDDKPAMLFDSANPTGGDNDLFSTEHGMVLIISEDDDSSDPDDNIGGRITIKYTSPVCYESIGFLDFEEQSYVKFYDENGAQIGPKLSAPTMGDGESKSMDIELCGIYRMKMIFGGSGALTDIQYCLDGPDTLPAPTPAPTDEPPNEMKIPVCVEDGDSYSMQEILESTFNGQYPQPGDEVEIDGEKYVLADDCTPEKVIEVCVLNGDRYIIAEILESNPNADSALKAGDEVEIDGVKYILADDCDLEELVPICVEDGDGYTMQLMSENDITDQTKPGDEVVVDGVTYILADDCTLEPTTVICVESPPGTFTMEVILASELGDQPQPGDDVTFDGSNFILNTDCSLSLIPSPTEPPTKAPTGTPTKDPTKAPTRAPTNPPTDAPKTDAPTASPRNMPTPSSDKTLAPTKGSGSGDPHFKTWTGDKYDYHGECDLVLVHNPTFMDGLGLRVHIRTTRVQYFSFIEKVAVMIGHDVLEFDNDVDNFYINGKRVGENKEHEKTMLNKFIVRRDPKALSIRIQDEGTPEARRAGKVVKIDLHTRKNGFPAVIVDAGQTDLFAGSLGMLGEWGTGRTLARDGKTVMAASVEDAEDFALEWQVRDTEPSLFIKRRFPQFPDFCSPPKKMLGGRLGLWRAKEEAEEACAHWKEDKDDCIFDVMATRDVMVAEEGHIVHIE